MKENLKQFFLVSTQSFPSFLPVFGGYANSLSGYWSSKKTFCTLKWSNMCYFCEAVTVNLGFLLIAFTVSAIEIRQDWLLSTFVTVTHLRKFRKYLLWAFVIKLKKNSIFLCFKLYYNVLLCYLIWKVKNKVFFPFKNELINVSNSLTVVSLI